MEGALALMIPIISVGGFFAWMIALSPVGKAFAERLRAAKTAAGDREGQEEVLESVEHLRREVAESGPNASNEADGPRSVTAAEGG